ncbi:MAG: PDZ domain-containing protein [Phycicoccus sp.]|nr:PDZ domain-containing protein [Phycicoccus sp.]NMM34874.1 PDZ domain-containing protein [Phycicoccus sp.]
MVSYPPPTGSPFTHQPPPTVEPAFAELSSWDQSVSQPLPDDSVGFDSSARTPDPGGRGGLGGLGTGVTSAVVAGAVVMTLAAALFGGGVGALIVSRRDNAALSLPVAPAGTTARPAGSIADIAARALPSVVTIRVKGADNAGTGSGFVLRKDGYILTNNHVVEGAAKTGKITVIFTDGKVSDAKIIGRDASYDLAVIRVDRRNLPVLAFGVSSTVVVGDPVIAVGAPLGLDSTVTSGIISALNRPVTPGGSGSSTAAFINAIQTDAAINPGNSGGPLLDMAGRVIGVNSAIARVAGSQDPVDGQSGSIGVGFAIPSDQARKTAEQLIATGKATHPVIGVMLDTTYAGEGVKIATGSSNGNPPITKGGPADKAGLKPGDVIIKFDGRPIVGPDEFVVAIRAKSVGDVIELTTRRGTSERTVKMTLQAAN